MQFTAAAAMRLAEQGKLPLDTKVGEIVAGVPNGQKITVRNLLQENSGLPDANDLPGFDVLLNAHQTPGTLIQFIRDRSPLREPGGKSQGEEHSAYNLLALIIEKKTGLPFKEAMRREVFAPRKMTHSGIDDDGPIAAPVALGHVEAGAVGLQAAPRIHWSGKTGNASAEYHAPELRAAPLGADEISHVAGRFKFGPDFFRPNATLELAGGSGGLIPRWPGGPDSPVLVTDNHHSIDRHY